MALMDFRHNRRDGARKPFIDKLKERYSLILGQCSQPLAPILVW